MADVYSILYTNSNWWNGTESWGGEVDESARDSKYSTRTFSSLSAWEADRDENSSSEDTETVVIVGAFASDDTVATNILNFNAEPVNIECPLVLNDGKTNPARHLGIWSETNCYRLVIDDAVSLQVNSRACTIDGIQMRRTYTSIGSGYAVYLSMLSGTRECVVKNSILRATSENTVLYCAAVATITFIIENSICYDGNRIIRFASTSSSNTVYNCILYDSIASEYGINNADTVKNCVVFSNDDDFLSCTTIDYCASDDGDGTNEIDWDNEATDWAANFEDYSNGDFTPKDADLPDAGIGPDSDSNVPTTDIIGNVRSGTVCTIGAFEFQSTVGYTWGEESPDEAPVSWSVWSDGAAGSPTIEGDSDWGKLALWDGDIGHSDVKDLGSVKTRKLVVKKDKYGSGSGNVNIYIRGQSTTFTQDAGTPSWELYSSPVKKDWRYIQVKAEWAT